MPWWGWALIGAGVIVVVGVAGYGWLTDEERKIAEES